MSEQPQRVEITDVDIPLSSMVYLILKFVIASIPAAIILAILTGILMGVVGSIGGYT